MQSGTAGEGGGAASRLMLVVGEGEEPADRQSGTAARASSRKCQVSAARWSVREPRRSTSIALARRAAEDTAPARATLAGGGGAARPREYERLGNEVPGPAHVARPAGAETVREALDAAAPV